MSQPLFINDLFVSYPNSTPSRERIPYTCGSALTFHVVDRLVEQIRSGCVRSIQANNEDSTTSLEADFRDGWATVYIVKDIEDYFEFVNDQCPDCETLLNLTGNGPTPQKHATEDMQLMARILSHFAETGEPYPNCTWEHTIH